MTEEREPRPIEKFTTYQLEVEIQKRHDAEARQLQKERDRDTLEKYKDRPRCAIVGRAYSNGDEVSEKELWSTYVKGNMGTTYNMKFRVPKSVETYFHNAIGRNRENEVKRALQATFDYYMEQYVEDPNVVATLIMLSNRISYDHAYKKEMEADFFEAAVERMCEFDLEALQKALENLKRSFSDNGHGQDRIISAAIERKGGNINTKMKRSLHPEIVKRIHKYEEHDMVERLEKTS
jgi:hypothetical protein